MSAQKPLDALADLMVDQGFATLETVWSLGLRDVRRALRLHSPRGAATAPSAEDLAALLRAFPDRSHTTTEKDGS
ncbi:MAG: hypothetical protein AB8B88_11550 [Devosiaceae bacterium]